MSGLSTHVLDLAAGRPAAAVSVRLYRRDGAEPRLLHEAVTGANGRAELLDGERMESGGYRLWFDIGAYFQRSGAAVSAPPFLDEVVIDFAVADPSQHYHVPLLVSPFGYTTYRGG